MYVYIYIYACIYKYVYILWPLVDGAEGRGGQLRGGNIIT